MAWQDHIPSSISDLYEVHDYRHAAAILAVEFPNEFADICRALTQFQFTVQDVMVGGGNESWIPKKLSALMRPLGWKESTLSAKIVTDDGQQIDLGTHKVDYLKHRVAFDLEWNSKDQTFDRDLYAFRGFFDYGRISVGVLVTRSNELDPWFASLGPDIKKKYGASTTHMAKLLP